MCRSVDRPNFTSAWSRSQAHGSERKETTTPRPAVTTTKLDSDARSVLLEAAEQCLRKHGYAGLSTRRVAEAAGMPLSQIHYHFGSKDALVLALLERQNQRLLERQEATFAADLPLWKRWEKARIGLPKAFRLPAERLRRDCPRMGPGQPLLIESNSVRSQAGQSPL